MSKSRPRGQFWNCTCGGFKDGFRDNAACTRSQIQHVKTVHRGQPWTVNDANGRVLYRQTGR